VRNSVLFGFASLLVLLATPTVGSAQSNCEKLRNLKLADAEITLSELVPAGPFVQPATPNPPNAAGQAPLILPAHCRVVAILKPTADSMIEVEVWLPSSDWNGKFQAVGNGGWAGIISYAPPAPSMALALIDHYATASTDTGHEATGSVAVAGADASFALGHPEKVVDFAYRAVHEMTIKSKAIITAFYQQPPRLSYWNGCSTGGRQGLMEAQRYPEDYDGIVAGAPASWASHLAGWHMQIGIENLKSQDRVVPAAKYPALHDAVIASCDGADGVKDGLLEDPRTCKFDPSKLLCTAGDSNQCLTAPQVESVKAMYGPVKMKNGTMYFPGLERGSELRWQNLMGGPEPFAISHSGFKYIVHEDPNWDWRSFDLAKDTSLLTEKAGSMDATNPDLQRFKARGGKLLLFHGWNDQLIPPENTVNYYSSVLAKMGSGQDDWLRLFMEPGMQHCAGGPGPDQFNAIGAMERWRESGIAPDKIIASHITNNRVDMTRPLCPYPQVAKWTGTGSTNDAMNFVCKKP
jgi:tannase/feruloyl esterase